MDWGHNMSNYAQNVERLARTFPGEFTTRDLVDLMGLNVWEVHDAVVRSYRALDKMRKYGQVAKRLDENKIVHWTVIN